MPKAVLVEELIEEISPEKIELKKTPRISKLVEKQTVETVSLKPVKPVKIEDKVKSSSEEEVEEVEAGKIKRIKKKKQKKPKVRKPQDLDEIDIEKPSEKEIEKIELPESVIVETVVEVEDTVVLKLDDAEDKPKLKPKTAKKYEQIETKVEELPKLKPVSKTQPKPEEAEMEQITLKPIPKDEIETEEKVLKKIKKKKPTKEEEIPEPEEIEKYVPEIADKIEFDKKPKEIEETKETPWRRKEKPKKEVPEEEQIQLKIGKGKIPKEESNKEEIKLKPVKREPTKPEEIPEKSTFKGLPESDERPKDYEKAVFDIPQKIIDEKIEVVEQQAVPISEEIREAEPVVEEPKVPWRRTPKEKPKKEEETVEMPKGKRKPLPEEEKEDIKLKPISKEKPEIPEYKIETETIKREFATEIPLYEHDDKLSIKPIDRKEEEDDEKPKSRVPKIKKPKHRAEEETKDYETPKVEIIEEKSEEMIPEKISTQEKVPEEHKIEKSETEITLIEKKKPVISPEKKEEELKDNTEEIKFQKDMTVQITSKKIKKEKYKTVTFDDGQPIPELEIISQKRVTEVVDKVPEEKAVDETELEEKTEIQKSILHKTIGKRAKSKTIAPRFIQRVEPVVSEEGKPATLVCKVEGTPFPDITWYKNEKVFQSSERVFVNIIENTVTLEFTKVEPQDVAIYSCKASNPAGVATSTANLVILEKEESGVAPHFTKPLQPKIVEEKETAKLECVVTGQPMPNILWFKEGKPIKSTPDHVLTFNPETGLATLEIIKPTPDDEKIYSVKAENKFGQAECRANLVISKTVSVSQPIVMHAPKITKPVQAVLVKPDEEIVLEAAFEGTPTPEITWLRNNTEIKPNNDYRIETKENTTKLIIKKKVNKKQKGGKYEVRAVNPRGEARSSGSVTVVEQTSEAQPPRFIEVIKPQKASLGDTVILEAVVEAIPEATFQWFLDSTPIVPSEARRVVTKGNKSVLLITEITPEFAGSITCRAENAVGSVTCTSTLSLVEDTEWEETREMEYPRFVKRLSPVRVMDGDKVEFTCVVTGKPVPKVQWYHNDVPVHEAKDVTIYQDTEGVCTLAISEVFPENAGEYTCMAVNRVGEAICKSSLIVEAYEYVPDSELGHMTGSEEDLLADKTISETDFFPSETEEEIAPKIIKKLPQVITAKDGEVTRFEVQAVGKPKPEGKWLKHGEEIIPSNEFVIENFDDGTSVLTITDVFPDDTGAISYEAFNPLGVAVTTTELLVETTEGIIGTKDYRKPEWVTHMEELSAALKAAQSPPTFIQEIKDIRTTEAETVKFECLLSGTPTPDVIWYHNDKIVRNTDRVKVRIEDNKTSVTITDVTEEDVGSYLCKAVSDIGEAVSKAKLYVQEIPEHKKQEIKIRKAKEEEERVKKERVKIEKKKIERKRVITRMTEKDQPLDVTEVQAMESTKEIPEAKKPERAKPILDLQQPLETAAIATAKKIDEHIEDVTQEKATELLSPAEATYLEEILTEEIIKDIEKILPRTTKAARTTQSGASELADITEVNLEQIIDRCEKIIRKSELKMAKEVSQMLKFTSPKEFGPGENPLREIAEIGYLLKNGITVKEVTVLYEEDRFPSLKSPQAQSAMVNVVERKGYGPLVSEVLTEESTVDESKLAATVGFRAFMKMIEANYVTIEEVITSFTPQDFLQRLWETAEVTEVTSKTISETATFTQEIEILEDSGKIIKKQVKKKDDIEEFPENEEPPLFVKRFEEQTVPQKAPLSLKAKVTGNPTPEIFWLRNNEPIEPSDRVTILYDGENVELKIKETNSELDSGDYKCIAVNNVGKASHGAKVSIEVDTVKFTKTLKEVYETSERETLELECETSHSVRTKWWYNNTEISGMDHRVVVQDGRTHKLIIKNISQNDEGSYKCTVKNQKTETTVKVKQRKLEFVKKLQDLEITEKETAVLEVEITSDTAKVAWFKDGINLDDTDEKFETERFGGVRRLLIRTTSIHDEGEYSCKLVDQECRADVTVIELPPEIITPLQDKVVNKGDKTVFEIELSKGDALARWYKDGKEIQFSEHIQLSIDGKRQKLKIYKTEPEDEGTYSCEVGTQSSKAKLTVQVPTCTFIKELPEFTVVPINTDAEFEVELSKDDVEVSWYRNNERIEKSSRYSITSEYRTRKLIVQKTTFEDEYEYTCKVEKYQLKTSSKLKIGDKPSPPRGPLEISGMSDTSFTIQWQPSENDGGSSIIEYIVEMREAKTKKAFKKLGGTKGETNYAINYLEKGHGYNFRITARNAIGISDPFLPSDTIVAGSRIRIHYQFKKTDETLYCLLGIFPPANIDYKTPPSPPINLKVKDLTSRSATLTWEPPEHDGGTEITGYVLEKKLEFMPKWEKVFTTEAFSLQYTFENLKEKSDYIFRVFAENCVGLSPPATSEVVQMRTHATVPSPPTPPLEIRTIGPNAIVVEWGIPESDGGSPLLGYNIAIRDTKKTMWMEVGRVQKGVQKFTIKDLQEDHDYMIRIFAKNEIGLSEPLESDEPFKVLPSGDTDQDDFKEATDKEPTSYSTETSTSWLRDNSMDADIHSYSKGTLLKKDEYFFRIWCYATKLFK
ncbi:unnamed protein product [Psylliodes chrysocephalus]|uniref:Titin n=1 Tax=Psylliodes chrysocephalus TaxID=3402493 RepID=A0A9P0DB37_9CUCU|nr:unnamed protein product [Psylliodes chrysocephala]